MGHDSNGEVEIDEDVVEDRVFPGGGTGMR